MTSTTVRRALVTSIATASLTAGLAAPALAEGGFTGTMDRWFNGDHSKNWTDHDEDDVRTTVTVARGCTQEFIGRVVRVRRAIPDKVVKKERINCRSYTDAVRSGDLRKAVYHFSITALPTVCHSRKCTVFPTTGRYRVKY